jgi:glycosyltransferase involved in cell wall biosynthesis
MPQDETAEAPVRVMHVITGLGTGGAETMLTEIVLAKLTAGEAPVVVSLLSGGSRFERLQAAGCTVIGLGMRRGIPGLGALLALSRAIKKYRPEVIQSWMYHADLAALLALWLSGRRRQTKLFWGVRCSDMDGKRYGLLFRLVRGLCAWLSAKPDGVIYNSYTGQAMHEGLGYRPRRSAVVHNGFDAERFRFDPAARARIRLSLGIADDQFVIGAVARVDPMKDYPNLLAAMARMPGVTALAVGRGTESLPPTDGLIALGERADVADILSAMDVFVSSSAFGEGLSNVIGEAMAAGRPVVTTNVGDAARLVGDSGIVVPPAEPAALADAVLRLRDNAPRRESMGKFARTRIESDFLLQHAIAGFEDAYAVW